MNDRHSTTTRIPVFHFPEHLLMKPLRPYDATVDGPHRILLHRAHQPDLRDPAVETRALLPPAERRQELRLTYDTASLSVQAALEARDQERQQALADMPDEASRERLQRLFTDDDARVQGLVS